MSQCLGTREHSVVPVTSTLAWGAAGGDLLGVPSSWKLSWKQKEKKLVAKTKKSSGCLVGRLLTQETRKTETPQWEAGSSGTPANQLLRTQARSATNRL
jgi:hypothetical protein